MPDKNHLFDDYDPEAIPTEELDLGLKPEGEDDDVLAHIARQGTDIDLETEGGRELEQPPKSDFDLMRDDPDSKITPTDALPLTPPGSGKLPKI